MREHGTGQAWHGVAEEIVSGRAEWRVQHPRATLLAMERAVDERLGGLRARLVQDVALRSARTDLSTVPLAERPTGAQCGVVRKARGKKTRRLTTSRHQVVELARAYAVCPACGDGLFPPG